MEKDATGKRRAGRPPVLGERGSSISIWVGSSQHDQLIKLAAGQSVSVSAYVRALVGARLAPRRGFPTDK